MAVQEEIASFLMNGLIEADPHFPGTYKTTERGAAHISQLCSLPWPVKAWVDCNGKIIS